METAGLVPDILVPLGPLRYAQEGAQAHPAGVAGLVHHHLELLQRHVHLGRQASGQKGGKTPSGGTAKILLKGSIIADSREGASGLMVITFGQVHIDRKEEKYNAVRRYSRGCISRVCGKDRARDQRQLAVSLIKVGLLCLRPFDQSQVWQGVKGAIQGRGGGGTAGGEWSVNPSMQ